MLESRPMLLVVLVALQLHLPGRIAGLCGSCKGDRIVIGCPLQLVPLKADVLGAKAI